MSPSNTCLRVLTAMRSNGSVTPRSFRHPTIDGGDEMDRLAARINELREAGYLIETRIEKSTSGKRFARYFLSGEDARLVTAPEPACPSETTTTAPEPVEQTMFDMPAHPATRSPYEDAA